MTTKIDEKEIETTTEDLNIDVDTSTEAVLNTDESLGENQVSSSESVVDKVKNNERPDFRKRRNERKPSKRPERARQEFDQKIMSVRRVARVVAGGRRFSFSVAVVIGDKKGRVGVGLGKSGETPLAVDKAVRAAKKNMVKIELKDGTISHSVEAKYSGARVSIKKARGKGIVAGSSVRNVLEMVGAREVSAKVLSRSKNKINNARAAIKALQTLKN